MQEFECNTCGHVFESEEDDPKCPEEDCGSADVFLVEEDDDLDDDDY